MPYARKAAAPVKGLHTLPAARPEPLPGNLMLRPGFTARMIDWHRRLNQISGDMVVSFKDGVTEVQLRDMARKARLLADEIGT